ncbi:MAG: recombinase family protein [Ruminococcus sp.]|nr:recombinase family protein [Ruminococcus sp.]
MKDVKVTKSSEGFTKYNNATHMEGNSVANQTNLCKANAEVTNEQKMHNNKTDERRGTSIMSNKNNANTAVEYIRDNGYTVASMQQTMNAKYAEEHNLKIEQSYVDYAGGCNASRTEFNQLKQDIESGKVTSNLILVHSIDRVHRNISNLLKDLEWCEKHGVRIIGVADGADITKRNDMFPYLL